MNDLNQFFGEDIGVSSTGDLASVSGDTRTQQRVLRRLLTNPGDYLWHPDYGAGLPQYVGQTLDKPKLRAVILGQMRQEDSVSQAVDPVVTLTEIAGGITVDIQYQDAATNTPQLLSFNVTN